MSLQTQEPRGGGLSLGGYNWLPRMLDKARLDAAGTIDIFDLEYPCPMDQQCLRQLGIDANTFQAIATNSTTDDAVLDALEAKGVHIQR